MFIEFANGLFNINHIIYLRQPIKTYNAETYSLYLIYGQQDANAEVEVFESMEEAQSRYEEVVKQLINLK